MSQQTLWLFDMLIENGPLIDAFGDIYTYQDWYWEHQ